MHVPKSFLLLAGLFVVFLFLAGVASCGVSVVVPVGPHAGYHHGPGEIDAGLDVFWDALDPYGDWLWHDAYGWVWTPRDVAPGWRPYTFGHWVYTPLGWSWVADEVWGWAPFHYGRWSFEPVYGWVWVPGPVWAPAWVAWRMGDGWIGWAPLPPRVGWRAGIGLDLGGPGGIDLGVQLDSFWWSFVVEGDFTDHRLHERIAPFPRGGYLLHRTRDVTRYEPWERGAAERGLPLEPIERAVGRPIPRFEIEDLPRPPERPAGENGHRRSVGVYRPEVPAPPPPDRQRRERPPEVRPPADDRQIDRRYDREGRDLDAWERRERQRLDDEQKRERQRPPDGVTPPELRQRHDRERQELDREVSREREAAKQRWERDKQQRPKPPEQKKPPERDKPKEHKPPPPPFRQPGASSVR